ncbi:unnamed protein product [Soboliphyme baturini]|uniref:Uncharacterized protein n=1 Tax=Soboliphyme baturini TaxID=241478 RepID=A0A183IPR9_9BILA|nr:unnamed protein product [Soboliphyme baturini]
MDEKLGLSHSIYLQVNVLVEIGNISYYNQTASAVGHHGIVSATYAPYLLRSLNQLRIVLGAHDLANTTEPRVEVTVRTAGVQSGYRHEVLSKNLALLEILEDFPTGPLIQPACISGMSQILTPRFTFRIFGVENHLGWLCVTLFSQKFDI